MRSLVFPILTLLAAGCDTAGDSNSARYEPSAQAHISMERLENAATADLNDVIGATPGPCGSTRAESALGKTFSPDLADEIKRLSGASEVNFIDFHDETPLAERQDPRRLNVLLSEEDRIILLDCG
jgi:hypothetical protein